MWKIIWEPPTTTANDVVRLFFNYNSIPRNVRKYFPDSKHISYLLCLLIALFFNKVNNRYYVKGAFSVSEPTRNDEATDASDYTTRSSSQHDDSQDTVLSSRPHEDSCIVCKFLHDRIDNNQSNVSEGVLHELNLEIQLHPHHSEERILEFQQFDINKSSPSSNSTTPLYRTMLNTIRQSQASSSSCSSSSSSSISTPRYLTFRILKQ